MKLCKICGKDISYRTNNAVRYCEECARQSRIESVRASRARKMQRQREEDAKKADAAAPKHKSTMQQLRDDAVSASRMGMSYGEYVAYKSRSMMAGTERCVCCGEIIPEGRQVCPKCERGE